jgi:hypothetical protein
MKRTIITIAAVGLLAVPAVEAAKPTPGALTIGASPTSVKSGGSVTLSGKLTGSNVSGRTVRIRSDEFPVGTFSNVGSATTNATGDWSFVVKPTQNTRYTANSGKADSPNLDVTVRAAVTLKLSDRTPRRGQRVTFSGRVCPQRDGVAIRIQRRTSAGWRRIASPVLADIPGSTCSSYSVVKRVRRNGTFRARFLGDANLAAGNSRVKRARVH